MRGLRWQRWTLCLASVAGVASAAGASVSEPAPEIVVAIRYLQQSGTSHAHLYLYREDGKLLRQLTHDESAQESNPIFSPDGETIAFTRELTDKTKEVWSVEPRGGNLHRLETAPEWYTHAQDSPTFAEEPVAANTEDPAPNATRVFPVPGGQEAVVVTPHTVPGDDAPDGYDVRVQPDKAGAGTKVGHLDGITLARLVLQPSATPTPVLTEGDLRVMFLHTHLNSTDGSSDYAVNLTGKRLVRLSKNGDTVVPLPGEKAFLLWDYPRYVPFGDGQHTANCSYFERWDAKLEKVRYAEKETAISYGASMYRPGLSPAVIVVRGGNGE